MNAPIKVLIVDDSPDDRLLYRRALSKVTDGKYEFIEAEDGESGLARIETEAPDCVLLDYSLPGRNGVEVLKRLRAAYPFAPVAMLTGQGNETVAVAAMQAGAQSYISKSSISAEALQNAIRVSIEHCAMQKRIHEQRASLEAANRSLEDEVTTRRQAEKDTEAQLERLSLLHQITRAIGDRQDLDSIFQITIRSLEEQLPAEFAALCLYDRPVKKLRLVQSGSKKDSLAQTLAMDASSIDPSGGEFARSVEGENVYTADLAEGSGPFARHLHDAGLRSVILAPLQGEQQIVGILILARATQNGFSKGECEFVRQLVEHVALAARQVQLYSALQQAYDKLHQTQQTVMQHERLRAVGQMASGIAHDINNALSPVALYTQALLDSERGLSARAREYLETTQRAVEDIAHTVARLSDFYRQREPKVMLVPVELNLLVKHAADLTRARWSDMALQRGVVIEMRTELAPNLPQVYGIESEIREALVNLILNAVDASPEGGTLTLRTSFAPGPVGVAGSARVDVCDTGAGMSEETRRRCLEPFFTTKGERGTGLGLAMVYGIAQRHGARVDIASELGRGTTISLIFEVKPGEESVRDGKQAGGGKIASQRLLLVDDDPLVLQSLRATLENDGHTVVTASGGEAGIKAFRDAAGGERFGVVITDLGMPHVDGRRVAIAVKQTSPTTPVILLTGWGHSFAAGEDTPMHVDRVVSKPTRLSELRAALSECSRLAACLDSARNGEQTDALEAPATKARAS